MTDGLSSELQKLEIEPDEVNLEPIKIFGADDFPLNLNPFYEEEPATHSSKGVEGHSALNGTRRLNNQLACRRCRLRRRSDHRRVVLRLPVLRKPQSLQKLLQTQPAVESDSKCSEAVAAGVHTNDNVVQRAAAGDGMDFNDLMRICQNLLEEDPDAKGRVNLISPAQRVSKSFTTLQKSILPSTSKHRANNNRNAEIILPKNSIVQQCTASTPSENNVSTTHSSRTSCSQQAGSSATSSSGSICDDVTIDELASYFDTFVHIPKKMSSMAEMMYI